MGKEFLIYSEVFHPGTAPDIKQFLSEEVLKVVEEEHLKKPAEASFGSLEVGCGAGYTAIFAALVSQKCKVWATDINDTAVKNNAKIHGVDDRLKAVIDDVFDNKEIAGKKFDMIYWDCPWYGQHTKPGIQVDMLMRSLIDPGYQAFRRYLSQARGFLKKMGRILVAFCFTVGSKELFERVVNETGWSYKISSRNIFLVEMADDQQEVEISLVEFFERDDNL